MKMERTGLSRTGMAGLMGIIALSGSALFLSRIQLSERFTSAGQTYVLPASAEVSQTLLPDGRIFEVHGAQGVAYLLDGVKRHAIYLPESRRFASITVMPGGQVLLWGGIDTHGQVFDTGEWFAPASGQFVRTGFLGLPARAGHTLTVLTDGQLLMNGGWSADGKPATEAVLWQPKSRIAAPLANSSDMPRLMSMAQLQADGSVLVAGGVDIQGRVIASTRQFRSDASDHDVTSVSLKAIGHTPIVAATLPAAEAPAAPIQGPLVVRFANPVNVAQLNAQTVTLLGPEGTVPVQVVGAEAGRLAFVQLPDDLYPASRYTLFLKGLKTAEGTSVPYTAVGFTTARVNDSGVVVAGQGSRPAASTSNAEAAELPPQTLVAGGTAPAACIGNDADRLCRKQSYILQGAWYPGRNNAPDQTGSHWRLYQPHQTLPDTRVLEAALPRGTTTLVGQVRQIDETPVANVEVSVGDLKTHTNAQGVFVLNGSSLPGGRQELFVDGRPAGHGDLEYGRFLVGADIKPGAISHMPFVMYLPRVLPRDKIDIPAPTNREVVLTHPDMPGLELHVPAGAVFKDREGHVLTHIAIVPTPVDHAPFPLPDNFPMYFTIQPGDAVVQGLTPDAAKGIRVVYPNYGHAKPATQGDFWVYGVKEGWQMYGAGHVTADAKQLAPDPGVTLSWALGAGASLNNANQSTNQILNNCTKGQPIDLQTGILFHEWNDLSIRDVTPLALTRAYTSADPNSHAFGIGGNSNFGIHLNGSVTNSGYTFTTPEMVLPCGEGIAFNLVSGSATWPFPAGTVWEHTGTDSAFYGATLQFLFDTTPDGAHWILTQKDGTQYAFTRHVPNALSWTQDRYGNRTEMSYNGGLLDQVISPSGRSITFNYDSGNRITSAVDHTGRTVGYTYNTAGTLATVIYPDQTTEQYTYDTSNRLLTMQDRRNMVWVTNQYDSNGRVAKQSYADATAYQFAYATDSTNTVTATTVTDPNGNQERVAFDPVSQYPSSDTTAYGTSLAQTITSTREPSGLIDSSIDALGRATNYTYDGVGNLISVTRLAGTSGAVTSQYTYTSDYNQLATVTDPLGHVTTYSYTKGCLTQITDTLGHSGTIQCNGAGQPVAMTDALGHTTFLNYQGYDLQGVTDALGRTTAYAVDVLGRRTAARDPLGNVTLVQYDTNDHVTQTVDALNQTTTAHYDGNGNPDSVTLPSGAIITTSYDSRNRPIARSDALQHSQTWTYDALNHVLTATDRKGQLTQYSYDALNRRALTTYADQSTLQASYDAGNRLVGVQDSSTGNLSWGYDGLDRMTAETTPQGTVSYHYDAAGRRIDMTAAAQTLVSYGYDNANRLTAISQGSETVQLGYDVANRRTQLTLPNSVSVGYGYDAGNQLTGLSYAQRNGTSLGSLGYSYDADGRRISQGGTLAPNLLPTASAAPGTFDLNNRQTSFNGQAMSYDANGNLVSDGVNTYTWNARNQLVQIKQGSSGVASYSYDATGRRTAKTLNGITTSFLYDGINAVQETQGSTVNPILTGLGVDERFARNESTGRTYFLADALGSTIGLTNTSGALVQQYHYDPYGNVTATNSGFTNPYQYTGREADLSGLDYYRARYYSPVMGHFISEDPARFGGGQLNFYTYAINNPLNYADPYGLWVFSIGFTGTAGIWGGGATGSAGLTFDSSGNVGTYYTYGLGAASSGIGGGGTASFLGSLGDDTTTINDLAGPFVDTNIGAQADIGGAADFFADPSNLNHMGGGGSLTLGTPGKSYYVGCTNTTVHDIGNIHNFDDYVEKQIWLPLNNGILQRFHFDD